MAGLTDLFGPGDTPAPGPGPRPSGTPPPPPVPGGAPHPGPATGGPGGDPRSTDYQLPPDYRLPQHREDQVQRAVEQFKHLLNTDPLLMGKARELTIIADRDADEAQFQRFAAEVRSAAQRTGGAIHVPPELFLTTVRRLYDELLGLGVLGPLWRDDEVTEILVDNWDRIVVEHAGTLKVVPVRFRSLDHAKEVAKTLTRLLADREVSPSNPLVGAHLPGARIQVAFTPVAKTGLAVSIRKFRALMGTVGLLRYQSLTPEMAEFLALCVKARANIVVSGGTGAGKTTVINALSEHIPPTERVITIEDAFELQLANPHVVSLQTKERASADDTVSIGVADLLVATLRMRPDRIIVGEIREPRAAAVMLQAANTGHDGTMTTIHANSPDLAVNTRLANLVSAGSSVPLQVARSEIASALDLVIQVTRRRGRRYLSQIAVLMPPGDSGAIPVIPLYEGTIGPEDTAPRFRKVADPPAESTLAVRLSEAGVSVSG